MKPMEHLTILYKVIGSALQAAMAFLLPNMSYILQILFGTLVGIEEILPDFLMQCGLILFARDHVVTALFGHLARDLRLATYTRIPSAGVLYSSLFVLPSSR